MSKDGRNLVTLPWEGVDGVAEPGRVRIWVLDAGRDWGQEEKGTTEDEMAGWHQ